MVGETRLVDIQADDMPLIYHARKIYPNAWSLLYNNLELPQLKPIIDFINLGVIDITVINMLPKINLDKNLCIIKPNGDLFLKNKKYNNNIKDIYNLTEDTYLLLSYDNILYKYNFKNKKLKLLIDNVISIYWINQCIHVIIVNNNNLLVLNNNFRIIKLNTLILDKYRIFMDNYNIIIITDTHYYTVYNEFIKYNIEIPNKININDIKNIVVSQFGFGILMINGDVIFDININNNLKKSQIIKLKNDNIVLHDIEKLYTNENTFFALKKNKKLTTFGLYHDEYNKNLINYENIIEIYNLLFFNILIHTDSNYSNEHENNNLYCTILPSMESIDNDMCYYNIFETNFKIKKVLYNSSNIAILKDNNSVISWSYESSYRNISLNTYSNIEIYNHLTINNVKDIYVSEYHFTALTFDNNCITWFIDPVGNWINQEQIDDIQFIQSNVNDDHFVIFKYNGDIILSNGKIYDEPINIFSLS